jgi:hypothetical protein
MIDRKCGDCSLCCKLLDVLPTPDDPFTKLGGKWCQHCKVGVGCTIYEQRYKICREYECDWLAEESIPDYWCPRKSKMILGHERRDGGGILLYVNCDVPGGWRKEPYITDLKNWIEEFNPCMALISESCQTTTVLCPNDIELDVRDLEYKRDDVNSGIDMDEVYRRYQEELIIADLYQQYLEFLDENKALRPV